MLYVNDQLVVFRVGSELYGVTSSEVREIVKKVKTLKLPDMPKYMKGIANLRGKRMPVYDVGKRLGLGERRYAEDAKIIVTSDDVGFIVDEVKGIIHINTSDIEDVNGLIVGVYTNIVKGFYISDDNVISILKLKYFTEDKLYGETKEKQYQYFCKAYSGIAAVGNYTAFDN